MSGSTALTASITQWKLCSLYSNTGTQHTEVYIKTAEALFFPFSLKQPENEHRKSAYGSPLVASWFVSSTIYTMRGILFVTCEIIKRSVLV